MAGCMIAAPSSGSGKTMVVCGMLEALKRKGKNPLAFKCGPDYIDGQFHRQVLGVEGGNLDSFFETPDQMRKKLAKAAIGHFVVAEGVMGYFDGLGGTELRASSWEVADILELPVLLVVDARGSSRSLSAQIQGFLDYDTGGRSEKRNQIRGVILNKISPMLYPRIRDLIEREHSVPVVGYVPCLDFLQISSRHLGLVLPEEIGGIREQLGRLADCLEETLDWERILELSEEADWELERRMPEEPAEAEPFCLAVARDEAFCFYYEDNLEALARAGARLTYFSPLHDKMLPKGTQGLLLGGGYPENHGKALAGNESLRVQIRQAAERGLPILGECGGYLYLLEELEGADGKNYPMCGVLKGYGYRKGKNGRFGYISVSPFEDMPLLKQGEAIRGHEFHYWDSTGFKDACVMEAVKPSGGRNWPCIRTRRRVMAGFPHLYYPSCPGFAERFAAWCRAYGKDGQI
ncbi:MAG: cobyrinate a,c-diamide synthase [Clostridiales bacterium]|nr:cobyrinate a,c-diamide synthase [Clostridiales bacterium]